MERFQKRKLTKLIQETQMTSRENWKPIDHYQEITDLVIKSMESERERWTGGLPWDKAIAMPTGPINAATNRHYRGINQLTLGILNPLVFLTGDPRFCSYKQATEMGWQVKKGSKASHAVFYKPLDLKKDGYPVFDENGDQKKSFVLRSYPVFHLSQIESAPKYEPPTLKESPWRTIEAADCAFRRSRAVKPIDGGQLIRRIAGSCGVGQFGSCRLSLEVVL